MDRRERDRHLVQRVLARQASATREFAERMQCLRRAVVSFNQRVGSPLQPDELEDVVQESLLAVLRKLDRYDGTASLETWVGHFCYLEFLRDLRRRRSQPRILDSHIEGSPLEPSGVPSTSVLDRERVLRCVADLDEALGTLVSLKHFEGLTFEQISDRLALPRSTVKTRYYRALSLLRQRLAQKAMGYGESDG